MKGHLLSQLDLSSAVVVTIGNYFDEWQKWFHC